MNDRLIELLQDIDHYPEKTCPKYGTGEECGDCQYKLETEKGCDLYARKADYLIAKGLIYPPCNVGDWIWYVYRNEINKAKVEEINYDASKHGYYSYNFSIYAYDFKNKRQVTYHPINETTKNKSNINGVEGMDFGEDVYIFLTKKEAEQALKERESNG